MERVSVQKAKPAPSAANRASLWFASTQRSGVIQRRSDGQSQPASVPPIVHEVLRSPGQPLDAATRAYMEPRFGHDFSKVRVHADTRAAAAASSVDARAFTSNQRIVFGIGEYAPQAQSGRLLLAHELAHVVQQRTGVQLKDGVGQAGDPYERHADSIANLVVQGRTAKLPFAGLASRPPTAEVAVLQKQNLPSPDITKVVTGKAVPTRKEIDDSNKENYFDIVDQGPDHYMDAIKYLIQVYKINSSHALMRYDPTMTGAYAITEGNVGDPMIPIRFGPPCFDKSEDFGVICRAVAHELLHTEQKAVAKLDSHDEREFLAYVDTLTRQDMPEISDKATLKLFVTKALNYYKNLSTEKQTGYAEKKKVVEEIKSKNGF